MIFYDTETCGLHSVPVLIQWAKDDGEVNLHSIWLEPIQSTLDLIEQMMDETLVGFNLAFDHFHLSKIYNMLRLHPDPFMLPIDVIADLKMLEEEALQGLVLKPKHCLDLMLHARKGKYQSTMDRKDIKIKRVPTALAYELANELNKLVKFNDLYFARSKNSKRWHVSDNDEEELDFKDVVLKFNPSSALKALAVDAGLADPAKMLLYGDVDVNPLFRPVEKGYKPYGSNWDEVIDHHVSHWGYNSIARRYATDDVIYTRGLYHHFDKPEPDDDDSILACMVASVRLKGFSVNTNRLKELCNDVKKIATRFSFINAPKKVRVYLEEVMDETERLILTSTDKIILEELSTWEGHPVAQRAKDILESRAAVKEVELYEKLIDAKRFHASFKVIGTLSTRMSGADDLNPQGIKRDKKVRTAFSLNDDPEYVLNGGDFDSFEVSLAEAEYNDPKLSEALKSGKKLHGIFGSFVFKKTYDEIMQDIGIYTRSKNGVFTLLYGGEAYTLKTRLGVDAEVAEEAYRDFINTYKNVGKARKTVTEKFCSMRQPNGLGTKVEWHEPADYVDSMLGFRRYFTLENKICKALFNLAEKPPKEWTKLNIKVTRRDREQSVTGAVRSALFGAAFSTQSSNMRAACNHRIQSTGAQITKHIQRKIWDLQPQGIHKMVVQPFNSHDEVTCVAIKALMLKVKEVVDNAVEEYRKIIPLISMKWKTNLNNWGEK
jgi:DNA polymerase I-like protein with 3'-5' exonuclease and polymerase domains